MQSRSLVSGGALIILGMALVFGGCSKKQPVVSEAASQDAAARQREEEEAARRAREAAIAERERRAQEESMRRSQQMGMTRDEFVNQDVLFAFDDYTLSDTAKSTLDKKAAWMRDNSSAAVKIEGHCDERGTTAYNLALGERRANAAKQYLSALGISSARMSTVSYGEQFPLDPGHTESSWVRNRRAHFTLGQ